MFLISHIQDKHFAPLNVTKDVTCVPNSSKTYIYHFNLVANFSTASIACSMGLGSVALFLFHVPHVPATRQPVSKISMLQIFNQGGHNNFCNRTMEAKKNPDS